MPKYSEYASSAHPPVQRDSIDPDPWALNTYTTVHALSLQFQFTQSQVQGQGTEEHS